MTAWTDVTIGRLTLRETFELSANISAGTDTRTLVLAGEESSPPLTFAQVKQRQEDILGLQNRLVPIRFGTKGDHDGWYRITDVNTSARDYQGNEVRAFTWGINAQYIGPENAVDLESRLTGVARINDFGLTGEKWHGTPATLRFYGSFGAAAVQRATADGASATVWRSLAASTNPRWASTISNYQTGRCRVLINGVERVATNVDTDSDSWVLSNGIVAASANSVQSGFALSVGAWDGTQWDWKAWNMSQNSSTANNSAYGYASVLRNDYEMCTVRLVDDSTFDRRGVDLTVRRGSRFIEGRMWGGSADIRAIWLATPEASTVTASTGYVRATSNDAQGNRFVCGSARTFAGMAASGGLSKFATTMDFFIGAEVGGSAAQTGDTADVLVKHYLTAMGEVTLAAVR